jgi:parallel beta-helix repeat protein
LSRKTVSAMMMFLLVLGTLASVFNVQPVKSDYTWTETIYVRSDGSIFPPAAPISSYDNVTYTLTDNIAGNVSAEISAIAIQRNDIIVDGTGHTLQGIPALGSTGIDLMGRSNVTIKNMKITAFTYGILLVSSFDNSVSGNKITANENIGVELDSSSNNSVSGNDVTDNGIGIWLAGSSYNSICENNITGNGSDGVYLYSSFNNNVSGNIMTANNGTGIVLSSSSDNSVRGNNITDSGYGVWLESSSESNTISENSLKFSVQFNLYLDNSSNNRFYLNSFITSYGQVYMYLSANSWDTGYPSGGNYWSTNVGTAIDHFRGVGQNESGIDGIADAPYIFGSNETDHYPLMGPFGTSAMTGSNVTVFPASNVGLIFSNVTAAGDVILNKTLTVLAPALTGLVGEYCDIKVSANSSGTITVRIIYDDSNMTSEQEATLQMAQYTPIPGDIRPDYGKLNMVDISYVARRFLINASDPLWDPLADVNSDGKINMFDIGTAARNFGVTRYWTNITVYLDTANNVIYGETTHFSLIGIR